MILSPSSVSAILLILSVTAVSPLPAQQAAAKPAPSKTHPAAAPAAKTPAAQIRYLCYTDPAQPVVYFSDAFNLPDPRADADQFLQYLHVIADFEKFLASKYAYQTVPADKDPTDCVHVAFGTGGVTAAAAASTVTTKKRGLAAAAVTAKKRTVDSLWKDTAPANASSDAKADPEPVDKKVSAADSALLTWKIDSKKDPLTGDVTTTPSALKIYLEDKMFVAVTATCSKSGVAFYFLASPGSDKDPQPAFSFYVPDSDNSDQVADVRMLVDGGGVHVARGYPNIENHTTYSNWMGLLFYQPGIVAQVARQQQQSVTTGFGALDAMVAPIVNSAARTNSQSMADNSAGPLPQLVSAHSIRIELPVTGMSTEPVLDLNPQDKVLHQFVQQCSAKYSGSN